MSETAEEFKERKDLFKSILLKNCNEEDVRVWEDSDKRLSVKMMSKCRRTNAYEKLYTQFGKEFKTYLQGYADAEGHQPVLELSRKEKSPMCSIM